MAATKAEKHREPAWNHIEKIFEEADEPASADGTPASASPRVKLIAYWKCTHCKRRFKGININRATHHLTGNGELAKVGSAAPCQKVPQHVESTFINKVTLFEVT